MTIQAIETQYKGCRFRSRLEARWAVFFDALGVEWRYESEGFGLPHGRYLPDFWLPKQEYWIEIKPVAPSDREWNLICDLQEATGKTAYLFYGDVEAPKDGTESAYTRGDLGHWWCECPRCSVLGIEYYGFANRLPCQCLKEGERLQNAHSKRLLAAYVAARSARFEHGEHGDRR